MLLLTNVLFSESVKIYLYTPEINTNNFKSLKINFDSYLSAYGNYELQPFSEKETFEKYVKNRDTAMILSSWHYREIAKKYNLKARLVAQKKGNVTDTKILIGQKNTSLKGVVTSAYETSYSIELLSALTKNQLKALTILKVPKEIDALMSVGFGMSKFALVSKESFLLLQTINPALSKELKIYYESDPEYRMLLAYPDENMNGRIATIFKEMGLNTNGKNLLNSIGIDRFVVFDADNLENTGDTQ